MKNLNENQKNPYYKGIPDMEAIPNKIDLVPGIKAIGDISMAAIYVIDFRKRRFSYVSDHTLFLCGHSPNEVLNLSYDFYPEIVYPDDLRLWGEIHNAILTYSLDPEEEPENINYFSFTLKFKNYSKIEEKQKYLMVHHKLKPIFDDGQLSLGICTLEISVIPTSGNLDVFYEQETKSKEYSFIGQKWKSQHIEPLTELIKSIIKFSKMGLSEKEIAYACGKTVGTIRNISSNFFHKLNVKNMNQAINVINNSKNNVNKY
jgi:DNA-binding CsgD family transcriptional regulator